MVSVLPAPLGSVMSCLHLYPYIQCPLPHMPPSKLLPYVPLANPQSSRNSGTLEHRRLLCPSLRLGAGSHPSHLPPPVLCVLCGVHGHLPRAKEHHEKRMHLPKPSTPKPRMQRELYPHLFSRSHPCSQRISFLRAAFGSSQ